MRSTFSVRTHVFEHRPSREQGVATETVGVVLDRQAEAGVQCASIDQESGAACWSRDCNAEPRSSQERRKGTKDHRLAAWVKPPAITNSKNQVTMLRCREGVVPSP